MYFRAGSWYEFSGICFRRQFLLRVSWALAVCVKILLLEEAEKLQWIHSQIRQGWQLHRDCHEAVNLDVTSLPSFKRRLKTELFTRSYPDSSGRVWLSI